MPRRRSTATHTRRRISCRTCLGGSCSSSSAPTSSAGSATRSTCGRSTTAFSPMARYLSASTGASSGTRFVPAGPGAGQAGGGGAGGLDPRPERLAAYPWRRPSPPTLAALVDELTGRGVRRFVLSHGGSEPDMTLLGRLVAGNDADFLVAGGVADIDGIHRLRDVGIAGIILGQALLSGAIEFSAALEAAA